MSKSTSHTAQFETLTLDADTLARVRGVAEAALAVLENMPHTQWPDLSAETKKAEKHLTAVLDAMNDSLNIGENT